MEMEAIGTPVPIAEDRSNRNYVAAKLSAMFNSKLFMPEEDITTERKREALYGIKMQEGIRIYERGALASRMFCTPS